MVTPTSFSTPDLPEPPEEEEKEEVESPIPADLVQESLPLPEAEKDLGDIEFSLIETPDEEDSAASGLAAEILNIPSVEENEGPDEQGLASALTIEGEMEEAEEAEVDEETENEDLEEEALDLATEEIPEDLLDPKAQEFRKLLDELLPLDDHTNILTPEEIDRATYLLDLDHNIFYTSHPLSPDELSAFRPTLLLLEYTEEEIRHLAITFIKPQKWERLIRFLKSIQS